MSRVLHGMPINNLPEPGEIKGDDQMVAYRQEDGKAYRTDVDSLVMGDLLDKVYPVGAIYMSVNSTDPSHIFGGTWQAIQDRFLLAAGDVYEAGSTGGSATVSLSSNQIPSHTHSIPSLSGTAASAGAHTHSLNAERACSGSGNTYISTSAERATSTWGTAINSAGAHTHSVTTNSSTTGSTGSGSAHENMPPYLTVYMWQRTA